ncbi:MAG: uroporphyrinogen decarboxylase family protein [Candidatus Hydrogenedentota bacterium]
MTLRKKRVQNALTRKDPDRVPVFMWFQPSTARRLGQLLEISPAFVTEAMGDDIKQAWVNNNYAMEGIVHEHQNESHTDDWGITWTKRGEFNQITYSPLAGASAKEVLEYEFPENAIESLLALMDPVIARAEDFYIGCDVSPCVFEMYWRLRGMEQTMLDLVAEPDITEKMLARCADFALKLSEEACERFPLDWLWTGDDVAGQQGMLMSPDLWRTMLKPHLKRVVDVGKRHGLPVAYHSCGGVRDIIPDLIEMGIEILNPIQCNCPGMEPEALQKEFGADLTFMGGVDTQGLLPHASADKVYGATRRLIETMSCDGGGYILAASHTVPPETPDENIFAMYKAAGISREEIFDRAAALRASLGSAKLESTT